ncbi:hypothetical protein DPV78_009705 [Talaromyces pinophilus]|nr:hypothetical protein DPV78_009705 [Talaromyces pinophilus]
MRSGLQTPCAVPLLAVLVAALLSITPNLCEAWTKPGSSPSIAHQADSSIRQYESAPTITAPTVVSAPSIITTFTNIDLLWQQVCQVTVSILSSYKHSLSHDYSSQQFPEPIHNSSEPHPSTRGPASITISLASIPRLAGKCDSIQSSAEHIPPDQVENSTHVNSSSPVDSKGSYMAILISLVVAIMWF